jgi:hypothetical protein
MRSQMRYQVMALLCFTISATVSQQALSRPGPEDYERCAKTGQEPSSVTHECVTPQTQKKPENYQLMLREFVKVADQNVRRLSDGMCVQGPEKMLVRDDGSDLAGLRIDYREGSPDHIIPMKMGECEDTNSKFADTDTVCEFEFVVVSKGELLFLKREIKFHKLMNGRRVDNKVHVVSPPDDNGVGEHEASLMKATSLKEAMAKLKVKTSSDPNTRIEDQGNGCKLANFAKSNPELAAVIKDHQDLATANANARSGAPSGARSAPVRATK